MPSLAFSTLVAAVVVAVIVEVLLLVSTLRIRRQTQPETATDGLIAPQPHVVTEALWAVVPALFLGLLFAAGLQTLWR